MTTTKPQAEAGRDAVSSHLHDLLQYTRGVTAYVAREWGFAEDVIDDIVQDACIEVLERDIPRLDPQKNIAQHFRFLRRRVLWVVGDARRRRVVEARNEELGRAALSCPKGTPDELLCGVERERLMDLACLAFAALLEGEREAITASFTRSCATLARELGVHASTITRRRDKGLAQLRAALEVAHG